MSLSIPQAVAAVAADFAARGITAGVWYGSWESTKHRADARVVIGLGPFNIDTPGEPNAPGYSYDAGTALIDGTTDPLVAPACASVNQTATVWVFTPPAPDVSTPRRMELCQEATAVLLGQTIAALHRWSNGSLDFTGGTGTWPEEGRVPGVMYGSMAIFTFKLGIPVRDDAAGELFPDPTTPLCNFTLG